jgi:hypothetical protein
MGEMPLATAYARELTVNLAGIGLVARLRRRRYAPSPISGFRTPLGFPDLAGR